MFSNFFLGFRDRVKFNRNEYFNSPGFSDGAQLELFIVIQTVAEFGTPVAEGMEGRVFIAEVYTEILYVFAGPFYSEWSALPNFPASRPKSFCLFSANHFQLDTIKVEGSSRQKGLLISSPALLKNHAFRFLRVDQ